MEMMSNDYVRGVIEAVLFISEKPVTLDQFREVLDNHPAAAVRKQIEELKEEYESGRRGMVIVEIAGGYQMLSNPVYATAVRSFFKTRVKEKLSRPALETLAIVAYKQPVSRGDIEMIRGVNSDGVTTNLLEKGLIKIVGRKDVPGRPYLYGTTKQFLEYFGLKALQDLPKLENFPALQDVQVSEAPAADGEESALDLKKAIEEVEDEEKKLTPESRLKEEIEESAPQGQDTESEKRET